MRSEMCSLHLTHPSVHTWSSGQPTVQRPGSSRGLPAGAGIRTHNLGLPRVSSPTLYPLGQRLPYEQCCKRLWFQTCHIHRFTDKLCITEKCILNKTLKVTRFHSHTLRFAYLSPYNYLTNFSHYYIWHWHLLGVFVTYTQLICLCLETENL